MKVIWAILCETAITDKETNNVSLINIVEELSFPASPPHIDSESDAAQFKPVSLAVVVLFARSALNVAESGEARIKMVAPDGTVGLSGEMPVDLVQNERLRAIGRTFALPLPSRQGGQYGLKVEIKTSERGWEESFNLPLQVKVQMNDAPE